MIKSTYKKYQKLIDFCLRLDLPVFSKLVANKIYDSNFFIDGSPLKLETAQKVAEIISTNIKFTSVFDIGCGMGIFLNEFYKLGKDVIGCDFSIDGLRLSPKQFTIFYADVTQKVCLNRMYDLIVCFEIAEHINKKFSEQLVRNCTNNGDRIAFTAAPPGQGGVGHINEQPYYYWIDLFQKAGFVYNHDVSNKIKSAMTTKKVVPWLANNFMYFEKKQS